MKLSIIVLASCFVVGAYSQTVLGSAGFPKPCPCIPNHDRQGNPLNCYLGIIENCPPQYIDRDPCSCRCPACNCPSRRRCDLPPKQ